LDGGASPPRTPSNNHNITKDKMKMIRNRIQNRRRVKMYHRNMRFLSFFLPCLFFVLHFRRKTDFERGLGKYRNIEIDFWR
jgi:hypothetical protein